MTLLTDEIKAFVGREVRYTAPDALGAAAFRYFALAVGDDEPIYVDAQAARAAGYDDVVAPPTFVCETNQYLHRPPDEEGYIGHSWDLPVSGCRMVRGGHEYEFGRPVRGDDVLTVVWRIDDIVEKTSSSGRGMLLVTSTATYTAQDGAFLARNRETMIYQESTS